MEEFINVFYGNNRVLVEKDINFKELRKRILKKQCRLIKYFSFENKKINENLLVMNFPIFIVCLDKNIFCEFKNGQYRCKRCRKYLKLNNLTCIHSNTCRLFIISKKKKQHMNFQMVDIKNFLKMKKKEFQRKRMITKQKQMKFSKNKQKLEKKE